jgi:Protein of unknown function (DUF2933)
MKNLHAGHCIVGVALAAVILIAFGASTSTLLFLGVALACPLMMIVMMKMMMGGNQSGPDQHSSPDEDHLV